MRWAYVVAAADIVRRAACQQMERLVNPNCRNAWYRSEQGVCEYMLRQHRHLLLPHRPWAAGKADRGVVKHGACQSASLG